MNPEGVYNNGWFSYIRVALFSFWVMAPCRLSSLKYGDSSLSETSAFTYESTRVHSPEEHNLHLHHWYNPKYHCVLTPWRKNPKVHHRTHNSPPPVSVLSQSDPIHIPQINLPKIHSDPIFPPTPQISLYTDVFSKKSQNNFVPFNVITVTDDQTFCALANCRTAKWEINGIGYNCQR
jgi:hypothetical protein